MHTEIDLGGAVIYFCDTPPEYPVKTGDNIAISVAFDDLESAKAAYEALKEGGDVNMELQETFWSKCFGSLTDKFGINWQVTLVDNQ